MSLSPAQRFVLIKHVNALVQPEFEALVFALDAPQSVIPSGAAAQGNRSSALLKWVEGPTGCGMAALLTMLSQVGPLPSELGGIESQAQNSQTGALAQQLDAWFQSLNYGKESYEQTGSDYWEWMITIPARRGYDRILVRCVAGEAGVAQLDGLRQVFEEQRPDEGWLISNRRVAPAAKKKLEERDYRDLYCYTLDEVIDQVADFGKYLTWLETEISQKGIDQDYIPLGCSKDEIDPKSHQKIGVSHYGEEEGWIEGYVDQWLADSTKEHLSVLGEFGTGKTWFALRYAWLALQKYQEAKQKGIVRPRLPLVIPLRDYAKAVSAESLFSEFFFRKHEIPLPSYKSFQQLNRMGKLLLIFDGFDEMAARINQQSMIDNFWELAKVVVPGAKAILTCRMEHFPDAIAGRQLLNAELKASTANLTGEPPQFEVLELAKFSDEQIGELLGRKAKAEAVIKVMDNPQLLDLARRPVMVELILEALPEIEQGKPVDMARVYLYAVTRKMERDIKSERTFTSLADKLYFLCELSWEMLSTNRMSLNYRSFPERLQQMFGDRVKEDKELDHWRYDMMGQTMLIRNSEGDYSPAHRSLLEFFVAYKIVASLGAMAEDFTAIARQQAHLDESLLPQFYTWERYFKRKCNEKHEPIIIAPLKRFQKQRIEKLLILLGQAKLAKAVLRLAYPMLDKKAINTQLLPVLQATKQETLKKGGYLGGNVAQLMLEKTPHALVNANLSGAKLKEVNFTGVYLQQANFHNSYLDQVCFSKALGCVNSVTFDKTGKYLVIGDSKGSLQLWHIKTGRVVWIALGHADWIRSVAISPDGTIIASGSDDSTIKLWSLNSGKCLRTLTGHSNRVRTVAFSPDGTFLASGSYDKTIKLWSVNTGKCLNTLNGHANWIESVAFGKDINILASGSSDKTVRLWCLKTKTCLRTLEGHSDGILAIAFSPSGSTLVSGSIDGTVMRWSVETGKCCSILKQHTGRIWGLAISPDENIIASASDDQSIKLWSLKTGKCLYTLVGHSDEVRTVSFSFNNIILASGGRDRTVRLWSIDTQEELYIFQGYSNEILSIDFNPKSGNLAFGGDDQKVKLRSINTSDHRTYTFEKHANKIRSVSFSPDGTVLASGSDDQTIKLWSVNKASFTHTLEGHLKGVKSVSFSPDGTVLASGSDDQTIKLWSVDKGICLNTFNGHLGGIRSVSFSPDGTVLASASNDQTVKLWSVKTGVCLHTLQGHSHEVMSVRFSPCGATLASGSSDNTVKIWSLLTSKCLQTFRGHSNGIWSVAFSPDGTTLASGSSDRTLKLWSLETGNCVNTIKTSSGWVRSVVFNPAGTILAFTSGHETICLQSFTSGECLHIIDERPCAGMDITQVVGITKGQKETLMLMGAIDQNEPA